MAVINKKTNFLKTFIKFYLVLLLVFIAFTSGILIGYQNRPAKQVSTEEQAGNSSVYNKDKLPEFLSKDVNFNLFWDVWNIIEENYVKQPVKESQLLYGAMAGSVASLGDPHSVFFDPQTTKEFNDELSGSFEGVGAEIAIKKDMLTIVAPLPDSPAEKAGLRSGDKIYAIDGEDTTGVSLDYAVSKIRGPKGSEVILSIGRDGLDNISEVKLIRDTIKIQSVKWTLLDNNIAHLEVRYFNEDTAKDFNSAVMEIISKNPKGIILDLRNDPGGYLDTAITVAGEWVDNNIVVYEKSSQGELKDDKSSGKARLKDFKTIVLVNEGSASASEIVAGALKDYKLGTLVGEKTFGKGSVQTMFPLDDGSSIKLTIAEWLTPNQNAIDGQGIEPDIKVELTDEDFNNDKDPQLDKAMELITNNQ